jgi:hypothetical protein
MADSDEGEELTELEQRPLMVPDQNELVHGPLQQHPVGGTRNNPHLHGAPSCSGAPNRSNTMPSETDTVAIPKARFQQLVDALAASVQLLQQSMGSGPRAEDLEMMIPQRQGTFGSRVEADPDHMVEVIDLFTNVQRLSVEEIDEEDAKERQRFARGKSQAP